ncbi:MAG: hypothetical protein DMF61_13640 [Blastocatellia bacterium AA13]|nr:MAG: hypothetical protein DMF61_13640 [Blastocatellia bacterium AA13]
MASQPAAWSAYHFERRLRLPHLFDRRLQSVLVIRFDPTQYNYILAGEEPYFVLRFPEGGSLVSSARCLHRGGPLHLGEWASADQCLMCPWHGTRYSKKILAKRAVPSVENKGLISMILDVSPETSVRLYKRTGVADPLCGRDS